MIEDDNNVEEQKKAPFFGYSDGSVLFPVTFLRCCLVNDVAKDENQRLHCNALLRRPGGAHYVKQTSKTQNVNFN